MTANRIVRELAASNPVFEGIYARFACALCKGESGVIGEDPHFQRADLTWHEPHCLWIRARKWVKAHE